MSRHTPFFELQEALAEPGCAICALAVRALDQFFASLVYERVNDVGLREALRKAYGLCAAHGAMIRTARSALGIAIIQRDMLRAATRALGPDSGIGQPRGWRATLLGARQAEGPATPAGPCVACALADEQVRHWAGVLGQHYAELRPSFQTSPGLCLDHLREGLALAPPATAAAIRDDQLALWATLEAELDEFIRKHDHQFAGEPMGAERNAWARATDLISSDWRVRGSRRGG